MNRSNSSGPPADPSVPSGQRVVPVDEWDWDEIHRIEAVALQRLRRNPKCEECGEPMVLGQKRAHYTCRPPEPPRPKLEKR